MRSARTEFFTEATWLQRFPQRFFFCAAGAASAASSLAPPKSNRSTSTPWMRSASSGSRKYDPVLSPAQFAVHTSIGCNCSYYAPRSI